jgi:hypothetical protein
MSVLAHLRAWNVMYSCNGLEDDPGNGPKHVVYGT